MIQVLVSNVGWGRVLRVRAAQRDRVLVSNISNTGFWEGAGCKSYREAQPLRGGLLSP